MTEPTFYEIAHGDHVFCSPIGEERAARLLGLLELPPEPSILDICCGKAELLQRVVERTRGNGLGVDLSEGFLAEGRERARTRGIAERVSLVCADTNTYEFDRRGYDLAMWIGGADHAGTFDDQVARLRELTRPGGTALIADLFWRKEPPAEHVSMFFAGNGPTKVEYHAEKAAIIRQQGLRLVYSMASNEDEWDHYEGLYIRAVERWAEQHPDDSRRDSVLTRARYWYNDYLQWRRDYLGFGFYLCRRA